MEMWYRMLSVLTIKIPEPTIAEVETLVYELGLWGNKSEFVREADQLVNDASASNPINYKVFRYNPASSFTAADFVLRI